MTVYWDLAAAWSFAVDYLLLLGTLRLAGRRVERRRIALAAALGAVYTAASLLWSFPPWANAAAMLPMCAAAFARTGSFLRLTLLFGLLSCALGGAVVLLGSACGSMDRLCNGVVYARIPWGIFLTAALTCHLLLNVVFRGGAKRRSGDFVRARISYGGRQVVLRLFRDTGNALSDPLTGEGVPVIEANALRPLLRTGRNGGEAKLALTTLRISTVGGAEGTLEAFRCDELAVDGRALGARLIAITPQTFTGGCQGLWYDEEESARNGMDRAVEQDTAAV